MQSDATTSSQNRLAEKRGRITTDPPRTTTVLELKLVKKGVPYWSRPDLGIDRDDVKVEGSRVKVTVHSLGAVDAPRSKVVLRDSVAQPQSKDP